MKCVLAALALAGLLLGRQEEVESIRHLVTAGVLLRLCYFFTPLLVVGCLYSGNHMTAEQQELSIEWPEGAEPEPNWRQLHARVNGSLRPTISVEVLDVFAGRHRQITRIRDVVMQTGQQAILFGE
jgi:hypothetical protein